MTNPKDRTMTRSDLAHPAHDHVTADNAQTLYDADGVEFAVSGDMTRTGYGTIGFRRNAGPRLFTLPGVRPKRATTGIRQGDTITLYLGVTGIVTRVGSIAGFMIVTDPGFTGHHVSEEIRWDNASVATITPNTESN